MTGLIATPCRIGEPRRHAEFFASIESLQKPPGTLFRTYSGLAHENHTAAVKDLLASDGDWIFFVDDDQLLPPDALLRLLSHNLDVVTVNFLSKELPWAPYLFQRIDSILVPETLPPNRGLHSTDACGLGGVLVRRHVFLTVSPPWFGVTEQFKTDDLFFCHALRSAGFEIVCDLDVCASHIIKASVRPFWDVARGQWMTVLDVKAGGSFALPPAQPTPQYQEWLDRRHRLSLKG